MPHSPPRGAPTTRQRQQVHPRTGGHTRGSACLDLKLSVAGQLTIFVTRAPGPFWSRPAPAPLLLGAVIGAQTIATVITVYGVLMTPLGWGWAGFVWAYALGWFLINDRVKLATYYWLDHHPGRAHRDRLRPKLIPHHGV